MYDVTASGGAPPSTLHVLYGNADLTFAEGPTSTFTFSGEAAGALSIGDFDNDTRADVLVRGGSGLGAKVLYGDGAGNFLEGPRVGAMPAAYTAYDIKADGTLDLVGAPLAAYGATMHYNYLDIECWH